MNKKIIVASDSTCDLGAELIAEYGIKILPLTVGLGDKLYADGLEIDPDTIYAHYEKTGELPKTSAVNIADFEAFFKEQTEKGYSVVFFTISSTMSATYHNACLAAEEFSDDVQVVDTQNLSTGGGLLVLAAAELAKEGGLSAAEIAKACREMAPRVDASFVIDNLEFLRKGGRCSAVEALGANLLHIKPCIVVQNGKMTVGHKYRGKFSKVLNNYIHNELTNPENIVSDFIFLAHAGCEEILIQQCKEEIQKLVPDKKILIVKAGCTISSHCGPNTLGVIYLSSHAA